MVVKTFARRATLRFYFGKRILNHDVFVQKTVEFFYFRRLGAVNVKFHDSSRKKVQETMLQIDIAFNPPHLPSRRYAVNSLPSIKRTL